MAAELQTDYLTGKTVYFLLRNSTGQIWNGSAFEAYLTANYATYDVAAAEQGTASGYYTADMPAVAAGVYYVVAKEQAGGSPAESDVSVGTGQIEWNGAAAAPLAFAGSGARPASGLVYAASGTVFPASGVPVLVYSGQLSGQQLTAISVLDKSGYVGAVISGEVWPASGVSVLVYSGQLSGQQLTARTVLDKSGYTGAVISGEVWLASGVSVLVYSGQLSGQVVTAASGAFTAAVLADGVSHGGPSAQLRLGTSGATPAFFVTNNGGDAASFISSGGGGHGLFAAGNGTGGDGIHAQAAGNAAGIYAMGGSAGGEGLAAVGLTGPGALFRSIVGPNNGLQVVGAGAADVLGKLVSSGSLSGQQLTARTVLDKSGYTGAVISGEVWLASGVSVFVHSGALSGQQVVLTSGFLPALAGSVLTQSVSGLQGAVGLNSLGATVLKLTSRFNAASGTTYRLDGTTVHMTQTPTTDTTLLPIRELGVAQ